MDNEYEVVVVDEKEIPEIVTSQFAQLEELETKVKKAIDMADKAKSSAETAHNKSAGLVKKPKPLSLYRKQLWT